MTLRGMSLHFLCFVVLSLHIQRVSPAFADDRESSFGDSTDDDRDVWGTVVDTPCSPKAPCIHLIPHTHLDPGWRDTFEGYHRVFSSRIHSSVVTQLAKDSRKRFTFADVSFLVRWLEESGDDDTPKSCAYQSILGEKSDIDTNYDSGVPDALWRRPRPYDNPGIHDRKHYVPPKKDKYEKCPATYNLLTRRLLSENRVDIVGGGWVSHDEAVTPVDLAAAQYEEGLRALEELFGVENEGYYEEERSTKNSVQKTKTKNKVNVVWQIDPFGHASATPTLLTHMGFDTVVLNRVPFNVRNSLIRDNGREFTWSSSEEGLEGDEQVFGDELFDEKESTSIAAHLLRRHYNVPNELDFDGKRGLTPNPKDPNDRGLEGAVATLIAEATASMQGVTHGHAFILVGDDFRWTESEKTFAAWSVLLTELSDTSGTLGNKISDKTLSSRKLLPKAKSPATHMRFRWSTPGEYFASTKRSTSHDSGSTRAKPENTRAESKNVYGSFFPYADSFPSSENAWVGSFVARRGLKNAIVVSSTYAMVASSLISIVDSVVGPNSLEKIDHAYQLARSSRRDAFLGLHHDAITGTCPKHVADDYFSRSDRAVANARGSIRTAAEVALRCHESEESVRLMNANDETEETRSTKLETRNPKQNHRVPILHAQGDALAVHNPRAGFVAYAEIEVEIAPGLVVVDARRDTVPLPAQRKFVDEGTDGSELFTVTVVVHDVPSLGLITLRAVHPSTIQMDTEILHETVPKTATDVDASFDEKGAWVKVESSKTKKTFARLTAAAIAFPRDEHFGDGPYVSRSATAHLVPTWIGIVLGFSIGYVVVGIASRFVKRSKRTKDTRQKSREPLFTRVLTAASFRRCLRAMRVGRTRSLPLDTEKSARRGLRFENVAVETNETSDVYVSEFGFLTYASVAFASGMFFPLAVWSPVLVSDTSYRALVDGGVAFGITRIGFPIGALCFLTAKSASLDKKARTNPKYAKRKRQSKSRFAHRITGFLALASCASFGAVSVSFVAPWRHARELRSRSDFSQRCYGGAVYTECSKVFGGTGENDPRAKLIVRKRVAPHASLSFPEIEWVATAPLDAEIVTRVSWSSGISHETKSPQAPDRLSSISIDTGVGELSLKPPGLFAAFTEGWSTAVRTKPSGKFIEFQHSDGSDFSSGIVFRDASTSVAFVGKKAIQLGVHRNALSDDGHGLRSHAPPKTDLSDPEPGVLAFQLVGMGIQSGDDEHTAFTTSSLRFLAHSVSRPLIAVAIPQKENCALETWSAVPLQSEIRNTFVVLSVAASPPPGIEKIERSAGEKHPNACPLWMRVQNLGPGALTAAAVENLVQDPVVMTPGKTNKGGLAYARWDRSC